MKTIVYMVRHAESPYTEGTERTRGLTLQGKMNAERITEILTNEGIHAIVSSPYARAILTLEGVAAALELDIQIMEDLRERHFSDDMIADEEFEPASKKMFDDPDYALPGGESNTVCQSRAVGVLKQILEEYKGEKVAIGTHGHVMTLMMNYFDSSYGLDFMNQTKKPDIYRLQFDEMELENVTRLWSE
ncbi:histidine phosphatase family protein [Paenibacillus sp. FSL H8-0104]|uniref:Histidine phosphatase family protein n=1 Tax=Paenibacillus amylolyticus TaxID=1451 RepID=A0ABD8AWZ0_PAEAM|nr:histidine phosphatase family protein [Paenibacillus sp. FSL R5-192]